VYAGLGADNQGHDVSQLRRDLDADSRVRRNDGLFLAMAAVIQVHYLRSTDHPHMPVLEAIRDHLSAPNPRIAALKAAAESLWRADNQGSCYGGYGPEQSLGGELDVRALRDKLQCIQEDPLSLDNYPGL
jgi:hypothetical protein